MGMYDTINGEQIKMFIVPLIYLPDKYIETNNILSYSGGSLLNYDVGDEVPYKTFWYNYGKDFNIIDFASNYYDDKVIIHKIRDGKNEGFVLFEDNDDKSLENILHFDNYNAYATKMKINNSSDLHNFLVCKENLNKAQKNVKSKANKELLDYSRNHKDDIDFEERYKELFFNWKMENKMNNEYLEEYRNKLQEFFIEDDDLSPFYDFGALVTALKNPIFKDCLQPNHYFLINDDRLLFIVGYNEMIKYIAKDKHFLQKYFDKLDLDSSEIDTLMNHLDDLDEMYDSMKNLKLYYTQFCGEYSLKNILDGSFKEYYLKYNILPYEGFDYSDWDVCYCDVMNEQYNEFDQELNNYVNQRMNDIER